MSAQTRNIVDAANLDQALDRLYRASVCLDAVCTSFADCRDRRITEARVHMAAAAEAVNKLRATVPSQPRRVE